jgi:CDP-4-dehydro-6-deoxyglucose reductase
VSGREFDSADTETLLDAALKGEVVWGYSCRTGRCSSCKAQLVDGDTSTLHPELGLSEDEKSAGWILTCVRTATSDVTLKVEDLGDVVLPTPKTVPCRINRLRKLADDVLAVTLRMPPATVFDFLPGQYIDLIGPDGVRRAYSVANAAREDKTIDLHIREMSGGAMSGHLFGAAAENDLLRLYGPLGTFFLRDATDQDLVFLATGTGIAPVRAILEALATDTTHTPRSVRVYWGGRHEADLYWTPEEWPPEWRFIRVLSRGDETWEGARGYVQDVLVADGLDAANTTVYACGSDDMIHSARTALAAQGLDEHRFFSDAFVSSAPA